MSDLPDNNGLIYTDIAALDSAIIENLAEYTGRLLAWDSQSNKYILANASWEASETAGDSDFRLVPADSSYVIGALVGTQETEATDGAKTFQITILSHGWTADADLIHKLTGGSAVTGPYYLTTEGRAVPKIDGIKLELPVYCFTYTSTGKVIFNPRVPERYGHNHGAYDLAVEDFDINGLYTPSNNSQVTTALNSNQVYLFKNGELLTAGMEYTLTAGTLKLATPPVTGDVIKLFTVSPTIGFEPLVRSVTVATDSENLLEVTTDRGDVELSFKGTADTENRDKLTGVAVLDLANGVTTGPVVQQIVAGAGVSVAPVKDAEGAEVNGTYQVSANNGIFDHRDMQVCNLDGVLFGVDDTKVSYKFPAGVESSLYGTFRLPHFAASASYSVELHLIVAGATGTVSGLSAEVTPVAATADGSARPATSVMAINYPAGAISGRDYLISTNLEISAKPNSLLLCRLTCAGSGDTPLTVLGISVSLKDK